MEESGEDQQIATFQGVTGADVATAQHVLEAHAWDLNRSVEFFLEQSAAPVVPHPGNLRAHAVSLDEADEDDEGVDPTFTLPVPATRMQGSESPLQARPSAPDHHASLLRDGASHDDELHRALAESARDAGMLWLLVYCCPKNPAQPWSIYRLVFMTLLSFLAFYCWGNLRRHDRSVLCRASSWRGSQ